MSNHAAVRTPVRQESRRTLIPLGLRMGQAVALAAPVAGLLVFALVSFKPAVTLYALVVGLALVLWQVVEPSRLALAVREEVRRHLDGTHAH